jgi:hypothetical protein
MQLGNQWAATCHAMNVGDPVRQLSGEVKGTAIHQRVTASLVVEQQLSRSTLCQPIWTRHLAANAASCLARAEALPKPSRKAGERGATVRQEVRQ